MALLKLLLLASLALPHAARVRARLLMATILIAVCKTSFLRRLRQSVIRYGNAMERLCVVLCLGVGLTPLFRSGRRATREAVQLLHQVFGPQVRIALEHLHRLVAADSRYLLIAQAGFHEPADSLVPQVVKAEVFKARCSLGIGPRFVEQVGASYAIPAGFAEEHQFGFGRSQGVGQC